MKTKSEIKKVWTLDNIWNAAFDEVSTEKERGSRSHLWASELGKSNIDLWKRLRGDKPTNPPDDRALRKFEAGNMWEAIVSHVLLRAGVLKKTQGHLSYRYVGLLEVTGRCDFIAGGKIDKNILHKIQDEELDWLPERTKLATFQTINKLNELYPDGLEEQILELKSTSTFMFENYIKDNKPSDVHLLQLIHYLKSQEIKTGQIIYLDRDSVRLKSFIYELNDDLEFFYFNRIKELTKILKSENAPKPEDIFTFDDKRGKFVTNWQVMYSDYLSEVYGFDHQEDYRKNVTKLVNKYNGVLKTLAKETKMTKKRQEEVESIQCDWIALNFDKNYMIEKYKIANISDDGDEENESEEVDL